MKRVVKNVAQSGVLFSLAMSVGFGAGILPVYAGPGDVNSINNGRDIQGGTYFNTPGSRTTFQNPGGGLRLNAGDLVRGLESSTTKVPTGNGGTLYFRAPGNIIRLDGNVDVSAVRNGTLYTGNGGKVFVDSAYLFQNGNIFANGANGGLVQFNVGGLTLGNNAKITAQGFGGDGGAININSTGTVDLRFGALLDTSGKVSGTVDTNVISVVGSGFNNQAIIRANGLAGTDFKPDNGDAAVMAANPNLANNPVPPPISAGNGTGNTAMRNILFETPPSANFRGGVIRLMATGQTLSTTNVINNANSAILTSDEKNALNTRNGQVASFSEGDVLNRNTIEANGALSKNGGTIILTAANRIINNSTINANGAAAVNGVFDANGNGASGGNGGTIVMAAMRGIENSSTGRVIANGGAGALAQSKSATTGSGQDANSTVTAQAGVGGQGGMIAFSYGATSGMINSGAIQANGSVGGRGGSANSFDQEFASGSNPNPVARAVSVAGVGGTGGKGGIIAFSSSANPTGGGSIQVNGGQGGQGGNAWADSQSVSNIGVPVANSSATRGNGGSGGAAGAILAPVAGAFASNQVISSKAGGIGSTGSAARREVTVRNGVSATVTGSTAVTPGSATSGSDTAVLATRRNEYLRHEDTAILLTQTNGAGNARTTLSGRLSDALIRTVANPAGVAGDTMGNAQSAGHLVIASNAPLALTNDVVNSNTNPLFFNLNTLSIVNNGNITNNTFWTQGVHVRGEGFHDMELALGGGHIGWLANGDIVNNQIVATRGLWSGGSTTLAATRDITNNSDFINIAPNKALLSGFTIAGPPFESTHAGSLTLKAGRDFRNADAGKLESNLIFFDIHPPLNQNPPIDWPKFLNGAQIGATVNLIATRNFTNNNLIAADALTYRNGQNGANNPALTIGGIVVGRAKTGTFTNNGIIRANGDAFFSPNESDGPRFNTNTFPRTTSFNGTVDTP